MFGAEYEQVDIVLGAGQLKLGAEKETMGAGKAKLVQIGHPI